MASQLPPFILIDILKYDRPPRNPYHLQHSHQRTLHQGHQVGRITPQITL